MVDELMASLIEGEGADIIASFVELNGIGPPPQTLAELIPWQTQITIAIALVSGVFGVLGKLAEIFANFRRW